MLNLLNLSLFNNCDTPRPWGLYFQDSAAPQMEGLVELHDNIMFYLVIILFGVGWILISIVRNYTSDKSPISHKYLNHGPLIELIWTITPALILLGLNILLSPHNPYQEKNSAFECGFHSFLGQNRTQFSISFFIFALLFLLFDLEILLVYPYVVSAYTNGLYGLVIMLIFFLVLTLGFAFEIGKGALKIDSRQMFTLDSNISSTVTFLSGFK